jgi:hypothetical protein
MGFEKPTRELSIGEIISQVFRLYRARFLLFLLPYLVVGVATAIVDSALIASIPPYPTPGSSPTVVAQWFSSFFAALFFITIVLGIISWVIGAIATGMVVKGASDVLVKSSGTLQESFNFAMSRLGSLLGASIITGILIMVGTLSFVVPGVILMIMFSLVVPAIIIEEKSVFESLERSRKLVSKRWGDVFVLFLIVGLVVFAASGTLTLVTFLIFRFGTIGLVISTVLAAFITPIIPLTTTSLYYSMLARESGSIPPPAPPPLL